MSRTVLLLVVPVLAAITLAPTRRFPPAANFSGQTASGDTVQLADYKGRVVVLDFWASWCKPCQKEFPFLIDLYEAYHEAGLVVIGINLDENPANMRTFLAKLKRKTPFPVIVDPKGKLPQIYNVEGMPTTVFIDRNGFIRYRQTGFETAHKARYVSVVKSLLGEKS